MELQEFCKHDALRDWMNFSSPFKHITRIQVPVSCDQSSRGYYLRTSDDESYFPGRAAEIVAYGQVPEFSCRVPDLVYSICKKLRQVKKKCSGMTQTIFFNLARFFCGYCI